MEEELLYKLNLLKNNFNPNNIEDLYDFLYIIYLNTTKLKGLNEKVNEIIINIFSQIFYLKKEQKEKNLLSKFISSRIIHRL